MEVFSSAAVLNPIQLLKLVVIDQLLWDLLPHSLSPDLASSDVHPLAHLKVHFGEHMFQLDDQLG